jgi:hypothetical protein
MDGFLAKDFALIDLTNGTMPVMSGKFGFAARLGKRVFAAPATTEILIDGCKKIIRG